MQELARDHQESIMQVRRQMLQYFDKQTRGVEQNTEKGTGRTGKSAVATRIRNRRLPAAADGAGPADQCAGDICIYAHAEAAAARAGATAADTDDIPNDTPNADRDK